MLLSVYQRNFSFQWRDVCTLQLVSTIGSLVLMYRQDICATKLKLHGTIRKLLTKQAWRQRCYEVLTLGHYITNTMMFWYTVCCTRHEVIKMRLSMHLYCGCFRCQLIYIASSTALKVRVVRCHKGPFVRTFCGPWLLISSVVSWILHHIKINTY